MRGSLRFTCTSTPSAGECQTSHKLVKGRSFPAVPSAYTRVIRAPTTSIPLSVEDPKSSTEYPGIFLASERKGLDVHGTPTSRTGEWACPILHMPHRIGDGDDHRRRRFDWLPSGFFRDRVRRSDHPAGAINASSAVPHHRFFILPLDVGAIIERLLHLLGNHRAERRMRLRRDGRSAGSKPENHRLSPKWLSAGANLESAPSVRSRPPRSLAWPSQEEVVGSRSTP